MGVHRQNTWGMFKVQRGKRSGLFKGKRCVFVCVCVYLTSDFNSQPCFFCLRISWKTLTIISWKKSYSYSYLKDKASKKVTNPTKLIFQFINVCYFRCCIFSHQEWYVSFLRLSWTAGTDVATPQKNELLASSPCHHLRVMASQWGG